MTWQERQRGTERLKKIIREEKLNPVAAEKLVDWWLEVLSREKVISLKEYRSAQN